MLFIMGSNKFHVISGNVNANTYFDSSNILILS